MLDWVLVHATPSAKVPSGSDEDNGQVTPGVPSFQLLWFPPLPFLCSPPPVLARSGAGVPAYLASVTGSVLGRSEHEQDVAGAECREGPCGR